MPVQILKKDLPALCAFDQVFNFSLYQRCGAYWLSQVLSAGILVGSLAVKLPQIFNIIWSKNVLGISPESFYSEVSLACNTVLYNYRKGYPFLSYGEAAAVLIQNIILVLLLWKFMKPSPSLSTKVWVVLLLLFTVGVCFGLPEHYLYLIPLANFPLMIYSRTVQIISNYRNSTTGQLSSITTFLTFAGNLIRIFTTIQQVGWDMSLISSFCVGGGLSGILFFQIVYYNFLRSPKVNKQVEEQVKDGKNKKSD
eukprot:gene2640-2884_t